MGVNFSRGRPRRSGLQSGTGGAGRKLPGLQSGTGGAGRKLPGPSKCAVGRTVPNPGRRRFVRALVGALWLVATPALAILSHIAPEVWVEAVRGSVYPGPSRRMDDAEIARVGKWAG